MLERESAITPCHSRDDKQLRRRAGTRDWDAEQLNASSTLWSCAKNKVTNMEKKKSKVEKMEKSRFEYESDSEK